MHEMGITRRILVVALERAKQAGATHIRAVHVQIGEESDVAPEALDFYWPELSRSTPADGAQLFFSVAGDDSWACRVTAIDAD